MDFNNSAENTTTMSNVTQTNNSETSDADVSARVILASCSTIFVLAVIGNGLVILTLVQNTRMRTVTNVFLLNLAICDLLLAVFCMPFTLIPVLLKNFIFGPIMCVSIRYAQGVSVGASCFTLVAISLERYFAICRPLHSRQWQTLSHAYKIICLCWLLALVVVIPIAISTTHVNIRPGLNACREEWGRADLEKAYTVFLDVVLLLIPLCLMTGSYTRIMVTLCAGMSTYERPDVCYTNGKSKSLIVSLQGYNSKSGSLINKGENHSPATTNNTNDKNYFSMNEISPSNSAESTPRRKIEKTRIIRQSNHEKSRESKIRVIRMLFVMMIEFFVCWTPLYAVQTWRSFHIESVRENLSSVVWSLIFMLSYLSSCCNPITYCFMNTRFRQAFVCAIKKCFCHGQETDRYLFKYSTRRFTYNDGHKLDETDLSSSDKSKS